MSDLSTHTASFHAVDLCKKNLFLLWTQFSLSSLALRALQVCPLPVDTLCGAAFLVSAQMYQYSFIY